MSPLNPTKVKKKSKIKQASRATTTHLEAPEKSEVNQKKGWKAGVVGYSDNKIMHLLKIIKKVLPLGKQSWELVTDAYNQFMTCHKYMTWTSKALRAKFDLVSNLTV